MIRSLRSPAALLAVACLVLVATRLSVAASLRSTFFTTGQQIYDQVAESLIHGQGFSNAGRPFVENPPLYPLAVAAAYWAGGRAWWPVAVLQALFDVGSLLLLYLLARRLFGQRAALLAAFMFALYPYLAGQSAILMDTSLFVLTLLAFLYLLTRAVDSPHGAWSAAVGVAAAAALLVRPPVLAVFLVTPALLALLAADRQRIVRVLVVGGGVGILLLVPWTVRNAVRFHAFVPTSAKLGENFYNGNSPHAAEYVTQGRSTDLLRLRADAPKPPPDWNQVRQDSWWFHRGLDWARAHPGAWAHALKVKLEAFWSWDLNPRTLGQTHTKEVLYTITYLPLLAVALAGLALAIRPGRRRELTFVALILGTFTLIHVLIVGYTRLRAPLDPLLMAVAGWVLVEAVTPLRGRRETTAPSPRHNDPVQASR